MSRSLSATAAGARAAGVVVTLGYLLGAVPGPVVAPAAGLALITFGRSLKARASHAALAAGALAVVAGGLGAAALRWEALGLDSLRGAQAVLGPTVLVGPPLAAAGAWTAAGGCVLALGVWLSFPGPDGRAGWAAATGEAVTAALAVVTVYWGEAIAEWGSAEWKEIAPGAGRWALAVGLTAGAGIALGIPARRLSTPGRTALLAAAAVAVTAGSIMVRVT